MYKRILVPLDGSDTSQRGLVEAIGLARSLSASLQLLHVVTDFQWLIEMSVTAGQEAVRRDLHRFGNEVLAKAAKAAADANVVAQTRLREVVGTKTGQVIVDEVAAADCNAIVMGTHGRKGIGRLLLGSDASWVISASPVPVLLVRLEAAYS